MAFFDKLGNTISAAGKTGLSKAKEIKDTAKITLDIQEREGAIRKLYQDLGQAYYHAHKDDENPEYEQVEEIKAAFEEIGELKAAKDGIRGIRRNVVVLLQMMPISVHPVVQNVRNRSRKYTKAKW